MKLAYLVVDAETGTGGRPGASPAIVLHGQGGVPVEQMVTFARRSGLDGRLVVPFGDYATTPSGMEVGGPCWYRSLPGGAGTDPLTLTRAVVQVSDVLEDVGLDCPVLVGWRQGAAVALGVGLHVPAAVGGVVAVDTPTTHLALLPAALRVGEAMAPPVLLVESGSADDVEGAAGDGELRRRGLVPETWAAGRGDGGPTADGDNDEVVVGAVARFVGAAAGRSVAEGRAR